MAGKKKGATAPKKAKAPKATKTPKAGKKAKGGGDADTSAVAPIGHNRIPTKAEMEPFKKRLDSLFEQKASKNAEFMTDIKGVYEEAANKLGVSRKVFRTIYGKGRTEEAFADWIAELEPKERDDLDRLTAAGQKFGADSPFGAWCIAQAAVRHKGDDLEPTPSKLIKAADKDKKVDAPKPAAAPTVDSVWPDDKQVAEQQAAADDGKVVPIPKGRTGHQVGIADGAENDGTLVN